MKNNSYTALAPVYEKLISDCDYEKWSQYLLNLIKEYSCGEKGLDLACGSGIITRFLAKNGYKISGMDYSEQMLTQAKLLSDKEKLNVGYFKGDLNNLKTFEKYDFITCINDGINYVKQEKLLNCFKSIAKSLNTGGLFLFDVSSEYKLKTVIGNNMFGEDREDVSYLWFNTLKESSVEMDLSFFIKNGETYIKKEESHVQYIHSESEIESALAKAGLTLIKKDEFGKEITEKSLRINYTVKKNG